MRHQHENGTTISWLIGIQNRKRPSSTIINLLFCASIRSYPDRLSPEQSRPPSVSLTTRVYIIWPSASRPSIEVKQLYGSFSSKLSFYAFFMSFLKFIWPPMKTRTCAAIPLYIAYLNYSETSIWSPWKRIVARMSPLLGEVVDPFTFDAGSLLESLWSYMHFCSFLA